MLLGLAIYLFFQTQSVHSEPVISVPKASEEEAVKEAYRNFFPGLNADVSFVACCPGSITTLFVIKVLSSIHCEQGQSRIAAVRKSRQNPAVNTMITAISRLKTKAKVFRNFSTWLVFNLTIYL